MTKPFKVDLIPLTSLCLLQ